MKRLRNVNGNTTYIYKEISFITILHVTTRRQSIAKPRMENSYGRLHMNIDVREIKQVVNILHIYLMESPSSWIGQFHRKKASRVPKSPGLSLGTIE